MFYLPFKSKATTSNPFTSTVTSCKGPTAYNCFDGFSPKSRSEQCGNQRIVEKDTSVHCSLKPVGAASAVVLKSQEDSSPWFVSPSLRHQGKQRLGNSI